MIAALLAQRTGEAEEADPDAGLALITGFARTTAESLNADGHHGLTGRPSTQSTVSLFLRKARNAGLPTNHGEIVGKGT